MAQGSRDGIRKPVCNTVLRARGSDLDLVRELPYGPAAHDGRIEAGQMSAPNLRAAVSRRFSLLSGGRPQMLQRLTLVAGVIHRTNE